MNNTNTYRASYCIIGNRDNATGFGFSTSIKKALRMAENKAWDLFYKQPNTNYADCWVNIYNPRGKMIWSGFDSELGFTERNFLRLCREK